MNIGTNRWSVKPELGISKALGPLTLDLAAGVTFYTDNDDFFGGYTRKQAPVYSVQGHLIYNFGRGVWGALGGTYYTGGRITFDGVEGNDLQESSRLGWIATTYRPTPAGAEDDLLSQRHRPPGRSDQRGVARNLRCRPKALPVTVEPLVVAKETGR